MSKRDRYLERQRRRNLLVERGRQALEQQAKKEEERRINVHFKRTQGVTVDPVSTALQVANGDLEVHFYGGETKMEKLAAQLFSQRVAAPGTRGEEALQEIAAVSTREAYIFYQQFYATFAELQNEEMRKMHEAHLEQQKKMNDRVLNGEENVYQNPAPEAPSIILPPGV